MKLLAADVKDIFGTISPPPQLAPFVNKGTTGEGGINLFLSNLLILIYSIAIITAIFMFVWAAWDWISSEGQKEKVAAAQKKIINTIIGIVLLATSAAILAVLGSFTGFQFFKR